MKSALQKTRWFWFFLWTGIVLVSIKSIFTDFGIDNGYAIAMSYRHISGDRMFLEMWEPHQTSAFVVDGLLLLYRIFVPSLTGAAIYLQIMGTLLWIPVVLLLYKELLKRTERNVACLICALLFVFRAKQTVFPEFSNLQIGFSILFFTFLIKFIFDQKKQRYLIVSAVFLCLEIISYPACLIAYVAAAGILLIFTDRKAGNLLIFSGVCAVLGALYVGYFVWARGLSGLIDAIRLLTAADSSHGADVSLSFLQYWQVFAEGTLYIAGTLLIAAVLYACLWKRKNRAFLGIGGVSLLVTACASLLWMTCRKLAGYEWHYCIVLVLLIVLGFWGSRFLTESEKKVWICGMMISFSSFFAVALLTNCALMSVVAYLPLAAAVSIIPLSKLKKGTFFAGAVLLFLILHRGWIVWGYSELSHNTFVSEVESIIRTGPAAGIISNDDTSGIYRDNVEDFKTFLRPDDELFLMADWEYDPLFYVQAGVDVAISSTISSPTYGEKQIDYWRRYAYKAPTLIAIGCYNGNFSMDRNQYSSMFEWVEANYECVGDGTWWRFYRRKGTDGP